MPKSPFFQYIDDVIDNKIVVGKPVRMAVERFLRDYDKKDYVFDYDAGERVVKFAGLCHHWKGAYAGKPIELLPHQQFYFINLFGWKNQDGTRRFRRSYKEIARKSAKTTESAIKSLFLITKDNEQGAQVYAAATKEDQATIVVNDAGRIIEASPALRGKFKLFKYKENVKRVVYAPMNSFIKPLGRDSNTHDGFDPHVGIIDEYHAHPDDGLINVIQSGMGMRTQPLIDIITTAGFNQAGPCYSIRKVCLEVLEGIKQDDTLFALIFSMDNDEEWEDEDCWIKANPNMADPILREKIILPYLRQRVREAKNEGSSKEVDVKTKNFNIWCDAAEVWISSDTWNKNHGRIKPADLDGALCFGGLDLASGLDLNAFALIFPDFTVVDGKSIWPVLCWFWMPEAKVTENREKMDYSDWVKAGLIQTTPGNIIDHEFLTEKIKEILPRYNHNSTAYDPYIAHHGVVQSLIKEGIIMNPISQGFRTISEPTKEWERKLTEGVIEHFDNPVLNWMNRNTSLARDANRNIKVMKIDGEKGSLKIDGIAACINALAQAMSVPVIDSYAFEAM